AQSDGPKLANALEATADQLETDFAKANFYLSSADVWARQAGDVAGAKAALSQASLFGAPPAVVARVARLLAAAIGDPLWYEDATRRLISQGAAEDEHAGLWFELGRARALRGERAGARAAFTSIASATGGEFLGNALSAFAVPLVPRTAGSGGGLTITPPGEAPWTPLSALADAEQDPDFSRALRLSVALRALLHGEADDAITQLRTLHSGNPGDLVTAGALSLLYRARGSLDEARDVLSATADHISDPELTVALLLASGIVSWHAGDRPRAVEFFRRASEERPEAAAAALAWALRAAEPNDPGARSRALDALADTDPVLAALERFALEVGRGGSVDAAEHSLRQIDSVPGSDIGRAAELARALWSRPADGPEPRRNALEVLASRGPEIGAIARAAAHQVELGAAGGTVAPDAEAALTSAERWALSDPSAAPALEWLAFSLAAANPAQEVAARCALAERLPEPVASSVRASAALSAALTGIEAPPLDGDHAAVRLARLELTLPGAKPSARAEALLAAGPSLGEESGPLVTAMAGYNQLAAGDVAGALSAFRGVVEAYPDEVIGWEGLRAAAEAAADRRTLAEASAALGDAVSDPARGAELWEKAASILLDELGDPARGEYALARAVERDIHRFSTFDRLFRMVRARKDGARLLELIGQRLAVTDDPVELVKLHWERARALREAGDREGALAALTVVRE
ncbi:MAG TPA: tetratricopeptide repeat protein, partial [Polyangiaceae bacterium]